MGAQVSRDVERARTLTRSANRRTSRFRTASDERLNTDVYGQRWNIHTPQMRVALVAFQSAVGCDQGCGTAEIVHGRS